MHSKAIAIMLNLFSEMCQLLEIHDLGRHPLKATLTLFDNLTLERVAMRFVELSEEQLAFIKPLFHSLSSEESVPIIERHLAGFSLL